MQDQYKNKILAFYKNYKRMPNYTEIMKLCRFKSRNAAYYLASNLIKEGFLDKDEKGKLLPNKIYGEIKILGLVEAGFPTPAEEDNSDSMSLDEFLIDNKDASYMLTVKGDSMIDASIKEGDIVIVERGKEPKEGDIVIAEIDGGWTMKYYRKKNGRPYLEPANKKYKPIYPREEMKIAAIVRAVVRKY